jgi:hypothetical protein
LRFRGITADTRVSDLAYTWDTIHNKLTETLSRRNVTVSGYGFTSGATYDFEAHLTARNRVTAGDNQAWALTPVRDWNTFTRNETPSTRAHGPTHEVVMNADQSLATDVKGSMTTIPVNLICTEDGATCCEKACKLEGKGFSQTLQGVQLGRGSRTG